MCDGVPGCYSAGVDYLSPTKACPTGNTKVPGTATTCPRCGHNFNRATTDSIVGPPGSRTDQNGLRLLFTILGVCAAVILVGVLGLMHFPGTDAPFLENDYFGDGYVKDQTMADGRKFDYWYYRVPPENFIQESGFTDPNGLITSLWNAGNARCCSCAGKLLARARSVARATVPKLYPIQAVPAAGAVGARRTVRNLHVAQRATGFESRPLRQLDPDGCNRVPTSSCATICAFAESQCCASTLTEKDAA